MGNDFGLEAILAAVLAVVAIVLTVVLMIPPVILTVASVLLTIILAVVPIMLSDGISVKRCAGKKDEADDDIFNGSVHNNSWFVVVSSLCLGKSGFPQDDLKLPPLRQMHMYPKGVKKGVI